MKILKNVAIFLAGGLCVNYLLAKGLASVAEHPEEGCVEYEDDEIKVIRTNRKKVSANIAVILHKNQSKKEES